MKYLQWLTLMACAPLYVFAENIEPVQKYHNGEYKEAKEGLQTQANRQHEQSAFLLGKMYMQGFGVPKNTVKGIELITKAAKLGKEDAQMYLAKYYLNQKDDFPTALSWFKKAAALGNEDAQMFCATAYLYGKGVKQNKELARQYIIDAAKNGNAVAQYELAKIFLKSRHKKDRMLGMIWLEKSAAANNPNAQYALGIRQFSGDGISKDRRKAVELLKAAADGGNQYAGVKLGEYFLSLPRNHRNFKEALYWYEKSAEEGNEQAQNRLGELYLTSWEDFSNPKRALHWLSEDAKQGDQKAQLKLAKIYIEGSLAPKDEQKAFKWLMELAKKGNAHAQREIAQMYYKGIGVEKNKALAIKWLTRAANNDDYIAKFKLESLNKEWNRKKKVNTAQVDTPRLILLQKQQLFQPRVQLENPDNVPLEQIIKALGKIEYAKSKPQIALKNSKTLKKIQKASKATLKEITRQAHLGYAKAQYEFGVMNEWGIGVKKDLDAAIDWYQASAAQNYLKADYALALLYLQGKGVKKNLSEAESWLRRAALKGYSEAQLLLGELYEYGYDDSYSRADIKENINAAKSMYGLAALNGSHQAQYRLALIYVSGLLDKDMHNKEIAKNHKTAFELFQEAAKANIEPAQLFLAYYYLGNSTNQNDLNWSYQVAEKISNGNGELLRALMYGRGIGVAQNHEKAKELLKSSSDSSNAIAKYVLGSYYGANLENTGDRVRARELLLQADSADIPFASYNLAVLDYRQHQFKDFLYLLQKAKDQGYQPASILLADYYVSNQSDEDSLRQAARIYNALAESGNIEAQIKLAFMYQNAIYFNKNYKNALEWYEKAAKQNNALAQFSLGNMLQIGQGTKRDLHKAQYWYEKAAQMNFVPAQVALGFINEVDMHNYKKALEWYRLAANSNDPTAIYNLGLMYEYGKGMPVDEVKAQSLLNQSARLHQRGGKYF